MNWNEIITLIRQSWPSVKAVYIYGSMVKGGVTSSSDVDIAVLSSVSLAARDRWDLSQKLALLLKRDVDLVDFKKASTVFQFQVVSTGERIFCDDPQWCEPVEDLIYSDYARLNEERKDILRDIKDRGSVF
jgi:uncharacterized protein